MSHILAQVRLDGKISSRMPIEIGQTFPDDDGERTMVWVTRARERERIGCSKVTKILSERPWVRSEVLSTETNSKEDVEGVDLYAQVSEGVMELLGIAGMGEGVMPFQVKSSNKAVRDFLKDKKMIRRGKLVFEEGKYVIAVNGTDAKDLILADIVGQMIVLAKEAGSVKSEEDFLTMLSEWYSDHEAVRVWIEQREVVLDYAWYSHLI